MRAVSYRSLRDWSAATLERLLRQVDSEAIEGGMTGATICRVVRGAQCFRSRSGYAIRLDSIDVLGKKRGLSPLLSCRPRCGALGGLCEHDGGLSDNAA